MTINLSLIRSHMEVVGPDGSHVGTVDAVEGRRIRLTRKDPAAQDRHSSFDADLVASVDDKVRLNTTDLAAGG
jgi:hypothetical protein